MSFILITADFPELDDDQFSDIFHSLQTKKWVKLHEHNNPEHTSWSVSTILRDPEKAIKAAKNCFYSCCIPHCIPRLAIEWSARTQPVYNHQKYLS